MSLGTETGRQAWDGHCCLHPSMSQVVAMWANLCCGLAGIHEPDGRNVDPTQHKMLHPSKEMTTWTGGHRQGRHAMQSSSGDPHTDRKGSPKSPHFFFLSNLMPHKQNDFWRFNQCSQRNSFVQNSKALSFVLANPTGRNSLPRNPQSLGQWEKPELCSFISCRNRTFLSSAWRFVRVQCYNTWSPNLHSQIVIGERTCNWVHIYIAVTQHQWWVCVPITQTLCSHLCLWHWEGLCPQNQGFLVFHLCVPH